jgi:ubiquinone/menaquinone biosynthesis C-methylase UbiE
MTLPFHPLRDSKDMVLSEAKARNLITVIREFFPARIPGFNPKRILDLGTGKGNFVKAGAEAGLDVYGIDIRDVYEGDRSRFVQADAKDMPFEDGFFDLVFQRLFFDDLVGLQGLENMHNLSPYIDEVHRVLRPGGFVYNYHCGFPLSSSDIDKKFKVVLNMDAETVYQKI